jgi:catechol 2,3-dioxygenase-like lactoylglutathione lyase family enzyme
MMSLAVPSLLATILGKAMQMSYVVEDIEEAMRFWTEQLKAGPFVVIEQAAEDRIISYRGRKTRVEMCLAFTYVGDVQIELISATCPDPTPWTDFINSGRQGLHHLGFWPDNYEEACKTLERLGFTCECTIEIENGAISANYFGAPPHMGVMIELAPNTPARNRYFGGIKAMSENWDGSRPIRRYRTREHYLASIDS